MRWLLSFLLFGFLATVNALSSSGSRLLVVLEELAEKTKYSKYLSDLECRCSLVPFIILAIAFTKSILLFSNQTDSFLIVARGFKLTFESPKSDKLALFEHGERAYDHLIILPSKSKGTPTTRSSF